MSWDVFPQCGLGTHFQFIRLTVEFLRVAVSLSNSFCASWMAVCGGKVLAVSMAGKLHSSLESLMVSLYRDVVRMACCLRELITFIIPCDGSAYTFSIVLPCGEWVSGITLTVSVPAGMADLFGRIEAEHSFYFAMSRSNMDKNMAPPTDKLKKYKRYNKYRTDAGYS